MDGDLVTRAAFLLLLGLNLVILGALRRVLLQQEVVMSTLDDFNTLIALFDAETNRLAALVESLLAQSQRTDLTAEQEATIALGFQAVADRLKVIGANPSEPVPPEAVPGGDASGEPPPSV